MNAELLPDLELFGVYDRGVPNAERVVLRANRAVNLAGYCLVLGLEGANGTLVPFPDQFLWLGAATLYSPGWVFVYTGPGTEGVGQERFTKEPIHALFWNKSGLVFIDPKVVVGLLTVQGVEVGNKPPKDMSDLVSRGEPSALKALEELVREDKDSPK